MTGGTAPVITAEGGTTTGATRNSPSGRQRRKNPRTLRQKTWIMMMRKSPAATVHPPQAGTTTVAAGPRNGLSKNGSTTRIANKQPVNPCSGRPGQESRTITIFSD